MQKRREYKKHVLKCCKNYMLSMQQMIDDDPQQFYKHVKYTTKSSNDLPSTMSYENNIAKTPAETANLFRMFFKSVYSEPIKNAWLRFDTESVTNINDLCAKIPKINIIESDILSMIQKLPKNLVAGPDNIPNILLHKCAVSLAKLVTLMLKESLQSGHTPQIWKTSYIYPIFKSGKKTQLKITAASQFNVESQSY